MEGEKGKEYDTLKIQHKKENLISISSKESLTIAMEIHTKAHYKITNSMGMANS